MRAICHRKTQRTVSRDCGRYPSQTAIAADNGKEWGATDAVRLRHRKLKLHYRSSLARSSPDRRVESIRGHVGSRPRNFCGIDVGWVKRKGTKEIGGGYALQRVYNPASRVFIAHCMTSRFKIPAPFIEVCAVS